MPTLTPRRHTVARTFPQPSTDLSRTSAPRRAWSPKEDPFKTVPAVKVDLRRGYAFGIAWGARVSTVVGLAFALYFLAGGNEQDADVSLAVASVAFLTALLAGHTHQRGLR